MYSAVEAGFRRVIASYQYRARKKRLAWLLTRDEAIFLLTQCCWYCGAAPSRVIGEDEHTSFVCNGIDRIDNFEGYVPWNVRSACFLCNRAKADRSEIEFIEWVYRASTHLKGKS